MNFLYCSTDGSNGNVSGFGGSFGIDSTMRANKSASSSNKRKTQKKIQNFK